VTPPMIGVVDDDPSILRALRRLLGVAGFTPKMFECAEALLVFPQLDQIRCLVLDIDLGGGLTGFDLQHLLATAHPRLPIILITALDDALTRERARKTGAVDHLTKPFQKGALIAAINRALDQP
jgi:FixJ family two-component response regulator